MTECDVYMQMASKLKQKFSEDRAFEIVNVSVGSKNPVKIAATKEGLEVLLLSLSTMFLSIVN